MQRSKTPIRIPEEEECSFQPKINHISDYLVTKNPDKKLEKAPVWENLYKLNNERKQVLEQKIREKEEEEIERDSKF